MNNDFYIHCYILVFLVFLFDLIKKFFLYTCFFFKYENYYLSVFYKYSFEIFQMYRIRIHKTKNKTKIILAYSLCESQMVAKHNAYLRISLKILLKLYRLKNANFFSYINIKTVNN